MSISRLAGRCYRRHGAWHAPISAHAPRAQAKGARAGPARSQAHPFKRTLGEGSFTTPGHIPHGTETKKHLVRLTKAPRSTETKGFRHPMHRVME